MQNTIIFKNILNKTKLRLLQLHFESNTGHIGGNFSCIDIMMTLHHLVMNLDDRFVLSKGHSAAALYVTLWSQQKITDEQLQTFSKNNTVLPGHPSGQAIPGLLFSTGSLGHGPSVSAGLALAAKYKNHKHKIYCLCSDGEWQEGSCWEALIFSVHRKLDNLVIIIDQNKLQGFGRTNEVISNDDLVNKIASFGANVLKINGHNVQEINNILKAEPITDKPTVLICETIKGKGLHFEDTIESHYLPQTKEQYHINYKSIQQERFL